MRKPSPRSSPPSPALSVTRTVCGWGIGMSAPCGARPVIRWTASPRRPFCRYVLLPTHPPTHPPTHLCTAAHSNRLLLLPTHPPTHHRSWLLATGSFSRRWGLIPSLLLLISIDSTSQPTHPPTHPPIQTNKQELAIGDWLFFEEMGAYTLAAASRFNGFDLSRVYYTNTECLP